jgi:transposase-like protein
MTGRQRDIEKERYWQQTIREAARSGFSIREFCRRHHIKESQFYWWQRRLNEHQRPRGVPHGGDNGKEASFALVSNDPGAADAGIELVLQDGRRLRISRGVDEQTLRAVLAAVEPAGC